MLSHSDVIVSIWTDRNIIAFGRATTDRSFRATLWDVVVDKNIRGYGLGKKIIDKAIQYAKNQGCYKIILDCNKDNIKFYEKCGFTHKEYEMVIYL